MHFPPYDFKIILQTIYTERLKTISLTQACKQARKSITPHADAENFNKKQYLFFNNI